MFNERHHLRVLTFNIGKFTYPLLYRAPVLHIFFPRKHKVKPSISIINDDPNI